MEILPCDTCQSLDYKLKFKKSSPHGEEYSVVTCQNCGLLQIQPQPSLEELAKYYSNTYFTHRTDRGYENYYSSETRNEIQRVFGLNLKDLRFEEWKAGYKDTNRNLKWRSLDIGCAAGYFVDYMLSNGFESHGIEVAKDPARFAKEKLKLSIHETDFLSWDIDFTEKFDVISLWATIEHLNQPKKTLEKILKHLNPGGLLLLSTCRYGLLAKYRGLDWRYLNVPEHLFYYSFSGLKNLLKGLGYQPYAHTTYGSGMTMVKNPSQAFFWKKKAFDFLVKKFQQGDMMAFSMTKPKVS